MASIKNWALVNATIFLVLILDGLTISQCQGKASSSSQSRQLPAFGRPMRQEFLIDPEFVLLDHGAYGTYPKQVQSALHEFQNRAEANPDLWMRREAKTEVNKIITQLAELVNAPAEDVVVIPNTTSGMNAILRSMVFEFGERILHFSTIYNSMGSIIKYICDYSNGAVTSVQFNLTYPITNDEIVAQLEVFLDEIQDPERPIRLALIDHITSVPGMIVPIERIIPMLKQRNITVLIDGAHAIGQIPIDLQKLAPDYYITNCHKWLYAARGCAMMFVDKKHQGTIHPAHINSGYSQPSNFQNEFFWTGTMDYSPYMTVTAALEFRRQLGGEAKVQEYNHNLAVSGGNYLATRMGTEVMQNPDQIANMVDVRLPIINTDDSQLTADFWIDTLLYRFPVYASPYKHGGQWWARFSAQIYNDLDDFETAAVAFLTICDEVNSKNSSLGSV